MSEEILHSTVTLYLDLYSGKQYIVVQFRQTTGAGHQKLKFKCESVACFLRFRELVVIFRPDKRICLDSKFVIHLRLFHRPRTFTRAEVSPCPRAGGSARSARLGGQQRRLLEACGGAQLPRFLILDDPNDRSRA